MFKRNPTVYVFCTIWIWVGCTPTPPPSEATKNEKIDSPQEAPRDVPAKSERKVVAPLKQRPADIPAPSDVSAVPKDAKKTPTGLASKILKAGSGKVHPKAEDTVEVHYTGWTTNGKMFDSSVKRGRAATFPLNRVIAGWTEGVQLMVEGEKRRFWIPEKLAYQGRPGAPQGMLVFDVELLNIR